MQEDHMVMDLKIKWYKSPIDKIQFKELTKKSDFKALRHVLLHISFSAATALFAFYSFHNYSWFITLAAVYIHGTFYNFLGMFTGIHELSHSTVFKSKGLNKFLYSILGVLTWNNTHKFKASHNGHHQVTVHKGYDLEVVLPARFRPIDWLFMFTMNPISGAGGVPGIFSMVWETIRYALGIFNREWETRLFPESDSKGRKKIFSFAGITLLFHIITATWFIWSGNWILIFIVTFGAYVAPWLATLCALPQHMGLPSDVNDWRLCCRTMILPKFIRFFYWNMNYHIEHHMYAGVPFYNLPELHETIKKDCPEPSYGLIKTWKMLIPVIKEQRKNSDYVSVPLLPERAQ